MLILISTNLINSIHKVISSVADYSFNAPAVNPLMICFWNNRKTAIIGRAEIPAPAIK